VLVPEIALTPQLVARFRTRLAAPVVALHSSLADGARLEAWRAAASGRAPVVIGTRSAVFTPIPSLGLVVVDEEHDASYKQQEGFRYSGRDLAVARVRSARAVPVVLGSATPSLESLSNAAAGRYVKVSLPVRTGRAGKPRVTVVDLRINPAR
jgi:primosomal protein N' (replication factor Y)